VSSHADTIRRAFDLRATGKDWQEAEKALDALLAENQRLRDALEIAADLLTADGYNTDPDYRREWKPIAEALDGTPSAAE